MAVLTGIILTVFVIVALLLIGIVLIQDEGGEGLGGLFGGQSQQYGRRQGNVLTRTTSILGTIFIVSSLSLAWLNRGPDVDSIQEAAREARSADVLEWWEQDASQPPADDGAGSGEALEPLPILDPTLNEPAGVEPADPEGEAGNSDS